MAIQRPILLGIVGDSAAGKTTITAGLVNILGADRVVHVCTDDYHKFDRKERAAQGITPLNPDCNYIDVLEQHIQRLHLGQPILKPVYDHSTGTLVRPEYVTPRQFVIVEGLLGFCTPVLRQFYDVKVFLAPPEEMRQLWKIKRDTTKRGYTKEQVLAEMERRETDSRDFIRPQRQYADMVVKFYPPDPGLGARPSPGAPTAGTDRAAAKPDALKPSRLSASDDGSSPAQNSDNLNVQLVLRPTIPHPDLSYLLRARDQDDAETGIRLLLGRDEGRPADFLEIDGNTAARHANELEEAIWQHLPDLRPVSDDQFGAYQDRREMRHSPPLALTQLLIAYHLLRKLNDLSQKEHNRLGPAWEMLGRSVSGVA